MFIELTDHLRCPRDHPEQFLVLLPSRMDGRRVLTGELGCPVCGTVVHLIDGIADWGDASPSTTDTGLTAEAVTAFLGLSGPGGFVLLTGGVTSLAPALARLLPGVRLVLVNPPVGTADSEVASVLRAARVPVKSASMRGAVIGADMTGRVGPGRRDPRRGGGAAGALGWGGGWGSARGGSGGSGRE